MNPDLIWKCNLRWSEINKTALENSNNFIKQKEPPIESLKALIKECYINIPDKLPAMSAGLFGYLIYEMINFEKIYITNYYFKKFYHENVYKFKNRNIKSY